MLKGFIASKNEVYPRDVAVLKQYRSDYFKITLHKSLRRAGYEEIDGDNDSDKGKKNTADNDFKLDSSLSRTKSKIFELALCNDWEYFATLTLNPEYHNREDLNTYKKKLTVWLMNYNRLNNLQIKYLLIPEQHKKINKETNNRSWHMHGFFTGIPIEHLHEFTFNEKLPYKMLIELAKGHRLFNWPKYMRTFGYISISKIICVTSVSKYITKYITKDLLSSRIELNDHMYYCSKGLKRAETVYIGKLTKDLESDYVNDYVKIKTLRNFEEAISYFVDDE